MSLVEVNDMISFAIAIPMTPQEMAQTGIEEQIKQVGPFRVVAVNGEKLSDEEDTTELSEDREEYISTLTIAVMAVDSSAAYPMARNDDKAQEVQQLIQANSNKKIYNAIFHEQIR